MSARVFVDTNVLVYCRDSSDLAKQQKAAAWMTYLWQNRIGCIGIQVLQEYFFTVTQKLQPGLDREKARQDVQALFSWKPVPSDGSLIETAWRLQDRFHLAWWDSLIIAAARASGADYLLSEDFQRNQQFGSLRVVSPFLDKPESLLAESR